MISCANGIKYGVCALCRSTASKVCMNCSDFYCSSECQRNDWENHRWICFPMPDLVPAELFQKINTNARTQMKSMPELIIRTASTVGELQHQSNSNVSKNFTAHSKQHNQINQKKPVPPIINDSLLPKDNSIVLLTGFRTPNRCYVRSLTTEAEKKHNIISNKINSYAKTAPTLTQLPKVSTYAVTEIGDCMQRVQVLTVRHDKYIRVLLCDSGKTAVRKLSELRAISEDILRLPHLAVMVQLRNVKNYALNEKLHNFLSKFECTVFKIKYDPKPDHGISAELFDRYTEMSLNNEVIKFCANMDVFNGNDASDSSTVMEKEASSDSDDALKRKCVYVMQKEEPLNLHEIEKEMPVMHAPFKMVSFKEHDVNLEVIVLDNSCTDFGYFGCITKQDLKELGSLQKTLENFSDEQPYKPRLNEYCIAKYENEWYRAKVISIPNETYYSVVYVDFTNESTLKSEDIRRYPQNLTNDCYTNLCLIDGLPEKLNDAHKAFLKSELTFYKKLVITVKQVEEQVNLVECHSVLQKMKDMQLL